jgi:hypothetical protein
VRNGGGREREREREREEERKKERKKEKDVAYACILKCFPHIFLQ